MNSVLRLMTRRHCLLLVATTLAAFVAINLLAYMHARSMTRFVDAGPRPSRPDEMSRGEKLKALFFGVNIPKPRNTATPADRYLAFETHRFSTTWPTDRFLPAVRSSGGKASKSSSSGSSLAIENEHETKTE